MKIKSKCCNAKIGTKGGGYDEKDICPIKEFCTKCKQVLLINGDKQIAIIRKLN